MIGGHHAVLLPRLRRCAMDHALSRAGGCVRRPDVLRCLTQIHTAPPLAAWPAAPRETGEGRQPDLRRRTETAVSLSFYAMPRRAEILVAPCRYRAPLIAPACRAAPSGAQSGERSDCSPNPIRGVPARCQDVAHRAWDVDLGLARGSGGDRRRTPSPDFTAFWFLISLGSTTCAAIGDAPTKKSSANMCSSFIFPPTSCASLRDACDGITAHAELVYQRRCDAVPIGSRVPGSPGAARR